MPLKNSKPKPTAVQGNPCIEITPTPLEYKQLCRDLATLRAGGAFSNTDAILAAVRAAADAGKMASNRKAAGRRQNAPGHGNRRSSPDAARP
jgi:hypothetical protein